MHDDSFGLDQLFASQRVLSIGDIRIAISRVDPGDLIPSDQHRSFLVRPAGVAEIVLSVSDRSHLPSIYGHLVFDTGEMWTLYTTKRYTYFHFPSIQVDPIPFSVAILTQDLSRGQVLFDERRWSSDTNDLPLLYHPLDHLLVIHYLPRCFGALIHACGVDDRGRGQMFVGASRAGKSTTGLLWSKIPDVTVLSDDRVVVRKLDGAWWMYGTPWAGDANLASPSRVPLKRIFFLNQAPHNYIRAVSPLEAVTRLLRCCFTTHWDKERMARTLEILDTLSRELPCYELGFKPDPSAVEFVRGL